jgi:hypothetical protein
VSAEIGGTQIISLYASPNQELNPVLDEIEASIEGWTTGLVIARDFNVRWTAFTKATLRERDHLFAEFLVSYGLNIENTADPTCNHQGRLTVNEYTLTQNCRVTDWSVHLNEESISDHLYITWNLDITTPNSN